MRTLSDAMSLLLKLISLLWLQESPSQTTRQWRYCRPCSFSTSFCHGVVKTNSTAALSLTWSFKLCQPQLQAKMT